MIKILCIGNSFSQDATRYLESIANSAGESLYVRNLYIGGCPLSVHAENIINNVNYYGFEKEGEIISDIFLLDALKSDKWNYVTLQQVSHYSGMIETYEPYFKILVEKIKRYCPQSEILIHRTWAYDVDSDHGGFKNYHNNQKEMFEKIVETTQKISEIYNLRIIKTGDAIQRLRSVPEFDYTKGGLSLCRDKFHMSLDYGRFAIGLIWYHFFTEKQLSKVTFAPKNTDKRLIEIIKQNITLNQ